MTFAKPVGPPKASISSGTVVGVVGSVDMAPTYRTSVGSVNRISGSTRYNLQKMDETNERLRKARDDAGFKSAMSAAKRFGWTPSTYASHENGQTPVPRKAAEVYAKAFKVSPAWLLNVEPANIPGGQTKKQPKIAKNEVASPFEPHFDSVEVPEIDLQAGANYAGGFGSEENFIDQFGNSVSKDVVSTTWGIPKPFLRDELRIQAGRAHILPVKGDSMRDILFDGDRAIVNLDDTDLSQGGIFALLDDNSSIIIKQVELVRMKGDHARRILCSSRNRAYGPFELELAHPVRIIGRVASKITRL
jgi:phage repressor protein C with HTH and peptisase S24 domain